MIEIPLFQAEFLKQAKFPVLDKRGKAACQHEIKTWTTSQFLEDGWSTIKLTDPVLHQWLERLIRVESDDLNLINAEQRNRSIRYGASLIYYSLFLQSETCKGEFVLPQAAISQEGSLIFDLNSDDFQSFGKFLLTFDEDLAVVLGGFIDNQAFLDGLKVTKEEFYLGAFFTYFVLANRAEELGMNSQFTVAE